MSNALLRSTQLVVLLFSAALAFGCSSQESVFSRGLTRPPTIVNFDLASAEFKAAPLGNRTQITLTVSVSGGFRPSINSQDLPAPFQWAGGSFPGTAGNCREDRLMNGCKLVLEFEPTTKGVFSKTLGITYQKSASETESLSLPLSAATPAEVVLLSAASVNLGETMVGFTTSPILLQIRHLSGAPAKNLNLIADTPGFGYEGGQFPGTSGNCPQTLTTGTCTVAIALTPVNYGQMSAQAALQFEDGAGLAPVALPTNFSSTVRHPAKLVASPNINSLGRTYQGGSVNFPITLTYIEGDRDAYGIALLGLNGEVTFAGGTYPGVGGNCPNSIASGSCTIMLRAEPTTLGSFTRTLRIAYRSVNVWAYADVTLSWELARAAVVAWSDASLHSNGHDFGLTQAGTFNEFDLTLLHTDGQIGATQISTSLPAGFSVSGGDCSSTLAISASCTMRIRFAPSTRGNYSGNLTLSYFNGATTLQPASLSIPLSGRTESLLTLSSSSGFNFGTRAVGSMTTQAFTLTHSAGAMASGINPQILDSGSGGGAYSIASTTCGSTLQSGSCLITARFNPTAAGSPTAQLQVAFANGVALDSVAIPLSATSVPPAVLAASSGTVNFGSTVTGAALTRTLTLSYQSGGVASGGVTVVGVAAPFGLSANGCTGGLASVAQTCTLTFSLNPTTAGSHSRAITLQYNDGATPQNISATLSATVQSAAVLVFSPSSALDFGVTQVGSALERTITVTHSSGAVAATALSGSAPAHFIFKGGTFPGSGGTCSGSLGIGQSCTLVVQYAPSARGTHTGNLTFNYNDGAAIRAILHSVQGKTEARLTLNGGVAHNFGPRATGATATASITLQHGGGTSASSISPSVSGSGFSLQSTTCSGSLSAGSCSLVVAFIPSANTSYSGTISVSFNNGYASDSLSVSLSGTGAVVAQLQFLTSTDWGGPFAVPTANDLTITLRNTGGAPATSISSANPNSIFVFKGNTYPGTGGTCGASLAAATNCTLVMSFRPTAAGTFSATLNLNYNNGSGATSVAVTLSGSSITAPTLTLGSTALAFPITTIGSTSDITLVINKNASTGPATHLRFQALAAPFSFAGGAFPGVGGDCSSTLTAAGPCTVALRFAPTTSMNTTSNLQFVYFDGVVDRTLTFSLNGFTPANLTLTPASGFVLGDRAVGGSHGAPFTLTRVGGPAGLSLSASVSGAGFGFAGGSYPGTGGTCGLTLPASSCTIVTALAPTSLGAWSGTLSVTAQNGLGSTSLTRPVALTAKNPANLGSPDSLVSFVNTQLGSFAEEIVILENTGDLTSASIAGALSGAGFAFPGGSYPGTGATCASTLAAGQNCTVLLRFSPPSVQSFLGQLAIQSHDGASAQSFSIPLRGDGVLTVPKSSPQKPSLSARSQPIPDQDGDGATDWVENSGSGEITVRSGNSGAVIYTLSSPDPVLLSGAAFWLVGDLDSDGTQDTLWRWASEDASTAHYEIRQSLTGSPQRSVRLSHQDGVDPLRFAASGSPAWSELTFEDGRRWPLRP